jgi:CubicO group peptidase (beta-lactamase class C family)
MKMNCLKCSLAALFLLFFQSISAQVDFSGVESILKQQGKSMGKDVVIMVNREGKNFYTHQTPDFTTRTAGPVDDLSKWFTAAVVMTFVDEGKIKLDDPVSKYIPLFEQYLKGYITIRHCLTHTTGIQADAAGLLRVTQKARFENLEAEIKTYVTKRDILDNPGEVIHYGQIGPNIAARVIEVLTRKTFDRVAQERLFRPLGMRNATFYSDKGSVDPAEGAVASPADIINFLTMLLDKGMFNGRRVLSEASITEMQKPQFQDLPVRYNLKLAEGMSFGLGNWIQEMDDNDQPSLFTCPGPGGIWPWLDLRRKSVGVIMTRKTMSDMRKEPFLSIKDEIDNQMK